MLTKRSYWAIKRLNLHPILLIWIWGACSCLPTVRHPNQENYFILL